MKKLVLTILASLAVFTALYAVKGMIVKLKDGSSKFYKVEDVAEAKYIEEVDWSEDGKIFGRAYVDLGLPSGTMWATSNLGTLDPLKMGDFYSWAETTSKEKYDWSTYKYAKGDQHKLTKYSTSTTWGYNGFKDDLETLQVEDDATKVQWDNYWVLPNMTDFAEMTSNCTWTFIENLNKSGINYFVGKSKFNGHIIIIPAAGYIEGKTAKTLGTEGYYWMREIGSLPSEAKVLNFFDKTKNTIISNERALGQSIRPILRDKFPLLTVKFYDAEGNLLETQTVKRNYSAKYVEPPVKPGYEFVGWGASLELIQTDLELHAKYVKVDAEVPETGKLGDYAYVDLGLANGLMWATKNVNADKNVAEGDKYAWGEIKPRSTTGWMNYKWLAEGSTNAKRTVSKYCADSNWGTVDNKFELEAADDVANVVMGSDWHMPSKKDLLDLKEICKWSYVEDYQETGVAGLLGVSKVNKNTIFFPIENTNGASVNFGSYWSSSLAYDASTQNGYSIAESASIDNNGSLIIFWESRADKNMVRGVTSKFLKKFKVGFYTIDNKLIEEQKVIYGGKATAPEAPAVKDAVFTGWSIDFSNVVSDLKVVAQYRSENVGATVSGLISDVKYVDLGLPSGASWATANMGTSDVTKIGDKYAWGEIETRTTTGWMNYKWIAEGSTNAKRTVSKYCGDSNWGTVDNKFELDLEDDAAYNKLGSDWKIPSRDDIKELMDGCTWKYTADFEGTGVPGLIGTSKANGNVIFFPSEGGLSQSFWTSEVAYTPQSSSGTYSAAYDFAFGADEDKPMITSTVRSDLQPIRPISMKNAKMHTVKFISGIYQDFGDIVTVPNGRAAQAPTPHKVDYYEFEKWDKDFSNVTADMVVRAVYKIKDFGVSVDGTLGISNVFYVDLGLPSNTKWAIANINEKEPTATGKKYAWGETETKSSFSWNNYKWAVEGSSYAYPGVSKYSGNDKWNSVVDNKVWLDDSDIPALPTYFSMPSDYEVKELADNCNWEYKKNFNGTGVSGYLGTSKNNGKTIFFPVDDEHDSYWTKVIANPGIDYSKAEAYGFESDGAYLNTESRHLGNMIRLVQVSYIECYYYDEMYRLLDIRKNTLHNGYIPADGYVLFDKKNLSAELRFKEYHPWVEFDEWEYKSFCDPNEKLLSNFNARLTSSYKLVSTNKEITGSMAIDASTDAQYLYVDLGLSCLWAYCNIGANSPTEIGYLYAWGDNEKHTSNITWQNYKWGEGTYAKPAVTKYSTSDKWGSKVDNMTVLKAEDEPADMVRGFVMPTKKQVEELIKGCTWKKTSSYKGSGVAGLIGTSKKNGNVIFFPADSEFGEDDYMDYWINSLAEASITTGSAKAESMAIIGDGNVVIDSDFRHRLKPIRPVLNMDIIRADREKDCNNGILKEIDETMPH